MKQQAGPFLFLPQLPARGEDIGTTAFSYEYRVVMFSQDFLELED